MDGSLKHAAAAVIVACSVTLLATASVLMIRHGASRLSFEATPPSYVVGETIDIPAKGYGAANHTLLVFARSTCAACQAATGTLRAIVATVAPFDSLAITMVTSSSAPSLDAELGYADEIGLAPAQLLLIDVPLRLKKVPAIALVDREGRVLVFREGPIDDARDEIVRTLGVVTAAVP